MSMPSAGPTAEQVNAELTAIGPALPAVPDHWTAMASGREVYPPEQSGTPMRLPQVPDAQSKHAGGSGAGYAV